MSLQLKNPNDQFPPGGFGFTDPKTGLRFNGYEGTVEMTANKVADHRRANPNLYDARQISIEGIKQEILAQKYAEMPWLFVGYKGHAPTMPSVRATPEMPDLGRCICGCSEIEPIYCSVCSGRRITGFKCKACGKTRQ